MNSKELLKEIEGSAEYKEWKKAHHEAYLSHLFCSITSDGKEKSDWEVGFFDPKKKKISVFFLQETNVKMKPADDVFAKEEPKVEQLDLEKVKLSFKDSWNIFKEKLSEFFKNEQIGEGFVILQEFEGKTMWNYTFITKTLKFANLKIDAGTGEILSHQLVNVVQQS